MRASLKRRSIPLAWIEAAVRTQRCPRVCLRANGDKKIEVVRERGAITGNRLAALFGRYVVEDVFLDVEAQTARQAFSWTGTSFLPMVWSDNLFFFWKSFENAMTAFERVAFALREDKNLRTKEDDVEALVSSCRPIKPKVVESVFKVKVQPEMKILGLILAGTGSAKTQESKLVGAVRGLLSKLKQTLDWPGITSEQKA